MIFLGGVDEAGLGPLLGPLCVGAAGLCLELDAELDTQSPFEPIDVWQRLAGTVSREPRDERDALVVGDSKVVFTRNERGARRLEATVLAFAAQTGAGAAVAALSALGCGDEVELGWLARHPWLAGNDPALPRWCSREFVELRAATLARGLAAAGVDVATVSVRRVEPGELNREFDRCGNKATAAWHYTIAAVAQLLHVAHDRGASEARIVVDRQGGRARYGPLLARALQSHRVHLVEESEGVSRYRLEGPVRAFVSFEERAESQSLGTALASCVAKYAREVSMEVFNAWFAAQAPDLAATAGYTTDGRRWLTDAAQLVAGLERDLVVRRR